MHTRYALALALISLVASACVQDTASETASDTGQQLTPDVVNLRDLIGAPRAVDVDRLATPDRLNAAVTPGPAELGIDWRAVDLPDLNVAPERVWIAGMERRMDLSTFGMRSLDGWRAVAERPGAEAAEIELGLDAEGLARMEIPLELPSAPGYRIMLRSADPERDDVVAEEETTVGALIGFRWNQETQKEEIFRLDPGTGETFVYGDVGDLMFVSWPMKVLVDRDTDRIYVEGFTSDMTRKLYMVDMWSGELINSMPLDAQFSTWSRNSQGQILLFRWNDDAGVQEILTLNPDSGATEVLGTVGDLAFWSNQVVSDVERDLLYIFGMNADQATDDPFEAFGITEEEFNALPPEEQAEIERMISEMPPTIRERKLYVLDAITGELQTEFVTTEAPLGAQLNSQGEVVFGRWNADEQRQELVAIDPTDGALRVVGQIGDLTAWSGQTVIDNANNTIYVFGMTDGEFDPDAGPDLDFILDALGMTMEEFEALPEEIQQELIDGFVETSPREDILYVLDSVTGELIKRTALPDGQVQAPSIVY